MTTGLSKAFYWTWRNEFNYKDFSLSFMLYSHVGHYDYYNHASNSGGMFDRFTTYDQPRWTPENPLNDYGRIGSYNFASYYKKKTFLRMDNITLSYGVPKDFLKRLKVQNMRISVSARNPFTLTGWDYFDVEATKKNRDDAAYGMRSYNISVNFTL